MARTDPAINFRLPENELKLLRKAVEKSGLPSNVWFRTILLAGAGKADLVEQIKRAYAEGQGTEEE
jgi:hypothetical protein